MRESNFNPVKSLSFLKTDQRSNIPDPPPPQGKKWGAGGAGECTLGLWSLSYNYWKNGKYLFAALHAAIQTINAMQNHTAYTNKILSLLEPTMPPCIDLRPQPNFKVHLSSLYSQSSFKMLIYTYLLLWDLQSFNSKYESRNLSCVPSMLMVNIKHKIRKLSHLTFEMQE